jgi:putative membrane protein
MAYDNTEKSDLTLPDYLASERTLLANERTFLAYIRTAMVLFATGLTIYKLLEKDIAMKILSVILCSLSVFITAFGTYRYLRIRHKLITIEKIKTANDSKDGK